MESDKHFLHENEEVHKTKTCTNDIICHQLQSRDTKQTPINVRFS